MEGGEEGNGGGGRGGEGLGKREGKEEEDMVVCECVSVCGVWRYVGATCGGATAILSLAVLNTTQSLGNQSKVKSRECGHAHNRGLCITPMYQLRLPRRVRA